LEIVYIELVEVALPVKASISLLGKNNLSKQDIKDFYFMERTTPPVF
jgi:hypothetical protein